MYGFCVDGFVRVDGFLLGNGSQKFAKVVEGQIVENLKNQAES